MSFDNYTDARLKLASYTSENCVHAHSYYQWIFPLKGNLELQIGKTENLVNTKQAALIVPEEIHSFASKNDNLFLVLDVNPEKTWINNLNIPSFWNLTVTLKNFLTFAHDYLGQDYTNPISHIVAADFLQKLLMQNFLSGYDPIILKAKNWIDLHYAESIRVNNVAKHCYLSVSQLQRRFKRMLGQCVGEYWQKKRLQEAQQLLLIRNTSSIEAIAQAVGYDGLSSFSRSFAQQFSISPTQWRNMMLSAKKMHVSDKIIDQSS